jgi:putative PIN family toxin of toxin-antitoxin system
VTQVVLDTNVIVAALRSKRGASHRLLLLVGQGHFEINLSVPLVLEYEDAGKRAAVEVDLSETDVDDVLDYLCAVGNKHPIHFLWRPVLRDARDDHVLELAVEAGADVLVTHNVRDFGAAKRFDIRVATPGEFLREIGGGS